MLWEVNYTCVMACGKYNLEQQVYLYDTFVKTKLLSQTRRRFCRKIFEAYLPARSTIWKIMRSFFMKLIEEEKSAVYFQQDSAI